jgi:hypothetical protein
VFHLTTREVIDLFWLKFSKSLLVRVAYLTLFRMSCRSYHLGSHEQWQRTRQRSYDMAVFFRLTIQASWDVTYHLVEVDDVSGDRRALHEFDTILRSVAKYLTNNTSSHSKSFGSSSSLWEPQCFTTLCFSTMWVVMALHKLEEIIYVRLLIKIYSMLKRKVYCYPRNI